MAEVDRPPVTRYRLEIVIDGNTIEELVNDLETRANTFGYEGLQGRTTRDQVGPRYEVRVTEPNPDMTPERYAAELDTWADRRWKKARA
jgi:hypothetical protein